MIGLPGQSLSLRHIEMLSRLQPGRVIEALDQETNQGTGQARARWLDALCSAGLSTYRGVWEGSDVGGPKGLDDLFAAGGRPRVRMAIFVPAATGEKRVLREVGQRGSVDQGVPLTEARRLTREAIEAFVSRAAKRR